MSEKAIKLTKEAGIDTNTYFLFGMPGETPKSIETTINFAIKLNPTYANFYALTAYPGTKVYSEARAAKMLIGDWSINSDTPYVKLPWINSITDLLFYENLAYDRFYHRNSYYLDFIKRNILHFNINEIKYAFKKIRQPIRQPFRIADESLD